MEAVNTNPYKTLIGQLLGWLHQLPVIGFNSGKYGLNVIKQFFVPYLLKPSQQEDNDDGNDNDEDEYDDDDDETRFVIKRQNTFMYFSTKKLKFLDIINFLAPGYSYDKYLKAYGCELQKGHFPCEYVDGIGKLEDSALPSQEAFYSRLNDEGISDGEYARCQAVWRDNGMKTMHDFLVWYNNRYVVPFLHAIDKQFAFYKQQNIDMFKDGVSFPGLTLLMISSTNFRRTPSSLSSTRRTSICTYSSKTISSVVRPSYFTATMKRTSPRYGTKIRLDRLWGTMPMLCTCGR